MGDCINYFSSFRPVKTQLWFKAAEDPHGSLSVVDFLVSFGLEKVLERLKIGYLPNSRSTAEKLAKKTIDDLMDAGVSPQDTRVIVGRGREL